MSFLVYDVKNFVTDDEISLIRNEVHSMKSDWKSFDQYKKYENTKMYFQNKDKMQHVLGDAIYLLHLKGSEGSREEIDWKLREKLIHKFGWIYERLFEVIKEHFNVSKVEFDETLPVPGFHVFGKYEINKTQFAIHQDSGIFDYYPNLDSDSVRSFVLLIESPKDRPFLDVIFNDPLRHLSEQVYYEEGTLHFWKGMLPHRIGAFGLSENEYRITFQGHFYVDPDTNIVKLYF